MVELTIRRSITGLMLFGVLLACSDVASAQSPPQRKVLLQQDLNFPNLQMVATRVEFAVGGREVPHTHPGLLSVYILEGTFTVEQEGHPATTYKAGDLFHVDAGKVHYGYNTGNTPVKLLATLVFEKGKQASAPAPAAK
jgi:quercetin dioxygenase-like cupin family protein